MNTSFTSFSALTGKHLRFYAALAGALAVGLCAPRVDAATEPSALNGQKKSYAYSWQQEVQQGADADKEITQQMGLYDNPQVQAYVQSVGQRVLAASTFADPNTPQMYRDTKFMFRVLDSSVVNAFALPGGYVYVTRGLLAHVDNEAQLAVVLGHEIGHVAARHASQQARRSQWSQLGVIAGAILGQAVLGERAPNIAQNVINTGGQALQVFMLRYSREAENEADTLGVGYALNAGYAAETSARFFDALRRLSNEEGKGLPTWLSTHPDPGNRADHVMQLVSERRAGPNGSNVARTIGEDEYLRHIDGIVIGDDPRQGFTRNGVFYHPTLHFQVPVAPNWKVDNQPTAVVFQEPSGRATMGLRVATANRTHDAATQFVSQNNVHVTASGDTAVNGLPATVIVGQAQTDQGQVGVWNAFIELEGKVYSLLGYAPAQAFEQVRPTFESVAAGFSPLRDPRLASVQPARLRIARADHKAPFASYIPTSLPPDTSAESVAIMNQVALNEPVPQGAALKIPDVSAMAASSAIPATVPADTNSPTGYPDTSNYPPQQPNYPSSYPSSYPNSSGYPSGTQYPPANGYPPQYPQSYPPASGYPPSSTTYPQSYPNTGSGYPSSSPSYPPSQTYPPQSGYPNSNGYPSTSPTQSYPPSYPQSSTTYPQSSGYPTYPQQPTNNSTNSSNPAPNWPR